MFTKTSSIRVVNHSAESRSSSCCRYTGNAARRLTHDLNRKDNALILSETLDENAVQTLLELSLADRFPRQCDEWHVAKESISDFYSRESTKRQRIALEGLSSKEQEMRRVLRDAVVEDVMDLFPCVILVSAPSHRMLRPQALTSRSLERDELSSYHRQSHEDASEVAGENLNF
jgi:hypothetical protein